MIARLRTAVIVTALWLTAGSAGAQGFTGVEQTSTQTLQDLQCPDANLFGPGLLTSICWDCLFPVQIGGSVSFFGRDDVPEGAADDTICTCDETGLLGKLGITVGFNQPTRLIELTRRPWCFPALGGLQSGGVSTLQSALSVGDHAAVRGEVGSYDLTFQQFHYYSFPITAILGLFDNQDCLEDGFADMDILFMSEMMPNWADDELAFLLNPETTLLGSLTALAAQPIDCAAATLGSGPIDNLWWTAGCWGNTFPMTGNIPGEGSPVRGTSLAATRALALIHRLGFARRRMGNDAVCESQRQTTLLKSMYRMNMVFPSPESQTGAPGPNLGGAPPWDFGGEYTITSGNRCCHRIGENTLRWGEWRWKPGMGEDAVYLLWKWTDCCVGISF